MNRRLSRALAGLALALLLAPAALADGPLQITQVGRLSVPERGYVIDLPRAATVSSDAVRISENGAPVRDFSLLPVGASGIDVGIVLALDASDSMKGRPFSGALAAARDFVARRGRNERVGVLAFNGQLEILQRPTASSAELARALGHPPQLAYGTRIYDALARSLSLLERARVSTGSIVLLSDGADVGSHATLASLVATARQQHVRIFTVGLRSRTFRPDQLRTLAQRTGGSYAEASSVDRLAPIYTALGHRLASEYVLRYRSSAPPRSHVDVRIAIAGIGAATDAYSAPTSSALSAFHRSLVSRFLLSPASMVALSALLAGALALLLQLLLRRRRTTLVDRIDEFAGEARRASAARRWRRVARVGLPRPRRASGGWLASLERDLEIAGIRMRPGTLVALSAAATIAVVVLLALLSPILALLGALTPFASRALVRRRLAQVRDEFADQLPTNLQVLASGLRAGHGFAGALAVVVENAHDPSRRELRRVLNDDQLGVPMEEAIRRVATRMASRDLEQVALLSELQRTAGGNAAEVLDTVVETIRERAEVRRLTRTLTAQGRMARWILTALPAFVAGFLWLIQPDVMRPMFESGGGQVALVVSALMVLAGSIVIGRIVDIEV